MPRLIICLRHLLVPAVVVSVAGLAACSDFAPTQAQLKSPQYQKETDCRGLSPQQAAALDVKDPGWRVKHPCWIVNPPAN